MSSVPCPLQTNTQICPDLPAISQGSDTLTYKELNDAVNSAAAQLTKQNIESVDRVAVYAPNSIEYVVTVLALLRIKAVGCFINTRLPSEGMKEQVRFINAKCLLTSDEDLIQQTHGTLKILALPKIDKSVNEKPTEEPSFLLKQQASIMFTSGSSSQPKAVMHTYGNHYYSASGSNNHIPFKAKDRWLLSLPLYHVGGLSIIFRALLAQATIVIPTTDEPLAKAVEEREITHISLVPTQLYRLLYHERSDFIFQNIKAILVGGSSIPGSLIKLSIENNLPIYASYGLTEMSSQVATSKKIEELPKVLSTKVLDYREVHISLDGEILVKGPTLCQGYVQGNHIRLPRALEGWFATGDLGHFSAEGQLIVTGRKDNMFISGGENIQPEEIERHLCRYEKIDNAVVIPVEDIDFGFRPIAFIQPKENYDPVLVQITNHLKEYLPKYKIPDHFYRWPDQIARDGTMKINRKQLYSMLTKHKTELEEVV